MLVAAGALAAPPETVAITYKFAPANEARLKEVIDGHWATVKKLDAVTGTHQLYRGAGFYLEIFTWKDADIPDHAPAEVLKWWGEMNKLVEKGGLSIEEIHPVAVKE